MKIWTPFDSDLSSHCMVWEKRNYFKLIIKHESIDVNIFLVGLNLLLQYTCPLEAVNNKCLEEIQIYL